MSNNHQLLSDLSIASLNVRGLHDYIKRNTIYKWCSDKKLDIVCLQETYCTEKVAKSFNKGWSGEILHSLSDSPHSRGVAILFKADFQFTILNKFSSVDGRRLLVNIKVNDQNYTIVNVYAPNNNEQKKVFFKKTESWINQHVSNQSQIIIAGDFNSTFEAIDRSNSKIDPFVRYIKLFIKNTRTVDAFRHVNNQKRVYTYFNKNRPEADSRIDHIFVSKMSATTIDTVNVRKVPLVPDHKAVIMKLSCDTSKGPGYWKLNTKLLENDVYKNGINRIVNDTYNEYEGKVSKRDLWDFCKLRIKEYSIAFSVKERRHQRDRISYLEKRIASLQDQLSNESISNNEPCLINLKTDLESEYELLYVNKTKGAQIRSKCKYIEEGERSTSYFLNLETRHQSFNRINSLKSNDGTRLKDTTDILHESVKFYKTLYTSDEINKSSINDYLNNIEVPSLSQDDKCVCEGQVTNDECVKVIKELSINKSPGYDGLPSEFYKVMWYVVGPHVLKSYEEAFINGELGTTHKQSVLSLIFKKGDREELKNYRPISLSNYDYKILAFVLARRLQKVIDTLVSPEQTAYIKNRFIGQNIRLVLDTMEYTEKKDIPGILIFLDFLKAYDSLNWNFMFSSLEKYGFGPDFLRWIHILYEKPSCMVKVNGFISEEFEIKRGIRQGCPISALLFILCTEFLGKYIKTCKEFHGIEVHDHNKVTEVRISQYADDTTLFIKQPENIINALDCVNIFSDCSGLKLNYAKTEGLCIGALKGMKFETSGISWPSESIRYLGIHISHDKSVMYLKNWENKLDKLQKLLDSWRSRNLTLFGKITIIKTLGIPQLIFSATMLAIPDNIIKKTNKLLYNFIWNSRDRIKRNSIIGNYEKGGLKMVDIESQFEAIKAAWVSRIVNSDTNTWAILARYYVNMFGHNYFVLQMNFQSGKTFEAINQIPRFYQEVILAFNKSKMVKKPLCRHDILNEIIWGNRLFTYKGKTLYSKIWIQSGIVKLKQIYDVQGRIDHEMFYSMLIDKKNYFKHVTMITKALSQYKVILTRIDEMDNNNDMIVDIGENRKSKYFYEKLCFQKFETPYQENKWNRLFPDSNIQWDKIYTLHFKMLKDKKIAEFSYKIKMNLLICESQLYLWKKSEINTCIYCNVKHSVEHMLFECIYAKDFWEMLSLLCNETFTFENVVIGNYDIKFDTAILTVAYIIYKKWLKDREEVTKVPLLQYMKWELKSRISIYKMMKYDESFAYLYELYEKIIFVK